MTVTKRIEAKGRRPADKWEGRELAKVDSPIILVAFAVVGFVTAVSVAIAIGVAVGIAIAIAVTVPIAGIQNTFALPLRRGAQFEPHGK